MGISITCFHTGHHCNNFLFTKYLQTIFPVAILLKNHDVRALLVSSNYLTSSTFLKELQK
jgi:hypothetical protein